MGVLFRPTEIVSPSNVGDALRVLEAHASEARILAGGTDLMVRRPPCRIVVDITRLPWSYARYDGDLRIGATTTLEGLLESRVVRERCAALWESARAVGSLGIRNMATLGGNLCTGAAARDTVPALVALDARVGIVGPRGPRATSIEAFVAGPGDAELAAGELVAEVIVPAQPSGSGAAFQKLTRHQTSNDVTVASAASRIVLGSDGVCLDARICVGAAAPRPTRAAAAERSLAGKAWSDASIEEAADIAAREISPSASLRGSAEYKREVARVLVRRTLTLAWARAREVRSR